MYTTRPGNQEELCNQIRLIETIQVLKVILPSVQYGLILWGACSYLDLCCSIERLHCRAARIIFSLPKDIAS